MAKAKKSVVTELLDAQTEINAPGENAVDALLNSAIDVDKTLAKEKADSAREERKTAKTSMLCKPSLLEAAKEIIDAKNSIRPANTPAQSLNNLFNEWLQQYVEDNIDFLEKYKAGIEALKQMWN